MQLHFVLFNKYFDQHSNEFQSNQQNQIRIRTGSVSLNEIGSVSDPRKNSKIRARSDLDPLPPLLLQAHTCALFYA